jgi:hypothetical protein
MKGKSFRITTPTLAILSPHRDGHRIPITIPRNAVVTVEEEIDGDRLVDVLWNGKTLMMFTQDIRMRGTLVDGE